MNELYQDIVNAAIDALLQEPNKALKSNGPYVKSNHQMNCSIGWTWKSCQGG